MTRRPSYGRWLILAGAAIVLAAAGVFLAGRPLSDQDQYASVGSFVLSIVSVVLAALAFHRDVCRERREPPESSRTEFLARGNGRVVQGQGHTVRVTGPVEMPAAAKRRTGRKTDARYVAEDNGVVVQGDNGEVIFSTQEEHRP